LRTGGDDADEHVPAPNQGVTNRAWRNFDGGGREGGRYRGCAPLYYRAGQTSITCVFGSVCKSLLGNQPLHRVTAASLLGIGICQHFQSTGGDLSADDAPSAPHLASTSKALNVFNDAWAGGV